ncbi:TIGR02186 family protein [uncultured Cohaesibacter sp.]|uniref:TIGR02186 family protein n=1 Tax=uncultured Cohaesibacter sp. TaxID=1002546 RepID=UPI002930BFE1|nr:TIGR02186 family protein [uncultured Cohaesibacter sp.]
MPFPYVPSWLLRRLSLALLLLVGLLSGMAHSEKIVADISEGIIKISSNYTGSEIVVFGMIQRDKATISRSEPYDVVIIVRGKKQTLITRRKDRTFGIWINKERQVFRDAPNFYALSSSRALINIAHPALLAKMQIGTENLLLPVSFDPQDRFATYDPFRRAALRRMREKGLYRDEPNTVTFLNESLFRSTISIPADVEVGAYDVTIHLFRDGTLLHSASRTLKVAKTGFEQHAFALARDYGFFYGLACVMIALFTGWLTGVVFRKN